MDSQYQIIPFFCPLTYIIKGQFKIYLKKLSA